MSSTICEREPEVLDAIASHRWPGKLSAELSAHVAVCAICQDLGTVAETILENYDAASLRVRLPSAGLVWWRAEIRARQEARRVASRPITVVQTIMAACVAGFAVLLLLWSGDGPGKAEFWMTLVSRTFFLPLLVVGAAVILASVALYLVLSDE
jgi:hypothetical protein